MQTVHSEAEQRREGLLLPSGLLLLSYVAAAVPVLQPDTSLYYTSQSGTSEQSSFSPKSRSPKNVSPIINAVDCLYGTRIVFVSK